MPAILPSPAVTADPLVAALSRWRATVEAELKGAPFEKKLVTRTPEGIALQPLYTRADLAGVHNLDTRPGEAPFLRGVRPLGYKTNPWSVAQEIAAGSAEEFNTALRHDLRSGQNAIVLTPDVAARNGCDPEEALPGSVGLDGISISSGDDFAAALKGVDLATVPLHLNLGADALPLASVFLEYARSNSIAWSRLSGSVTADPLGEWISHGRLPAKLDDLYDSLAGWTGWVETYLPALKTIGVDATVWGDAGGTATHELAFALAAAAEHLRALGERGVSSATAAARVEFRFVIGSQFFSEIAKFRAFRPLWSRVVSAFGADPTLAAVATVRAATGHWNKTLLDPHVNMLRVTTEALSAVLGGCDALHVAPFDEVTGATNTFSRRIARNVHTLLAEEFSFAATADPAGGSWYIEKLTDDIARKAWALFQDIEGRGGLAATLRTSYPQQLIAKVAEEKRAAVATRRAGVVGTNLFPNLKETPMVILKRDVPAQVETGAGRRAVYSEVGAWASRFATALSLARAGATVGQLSRLSRSCDDPERAIPPLSPRRAAVEFEELRAASAEFAARTGARPRVFLAKIGPAAQHKARADFAAGFFAASGFEALAKQNFETAETAAQAAIASGAPVAVLCSTDETYPALVPWFAKMIKAAESKITVVLAGLPADAALTAAYREAGVDEFIHVRANVCEALGKILKRIGAQA